MVPTMKDTCYDRLIFSFIMIAILINHCSLSETIKCMDPQECHSECIKCGESNCNVNCDGPQSCHSGTIVCGDNLCNVYCTGAQSCHSANVQCSDRICDVKCGDGQSCHSAIVHCGKSICKLDCGGSCYSMTVHAADATAFNCTGSSCDSLSVNYNTTDSAANYDCVDTREIIIISVVVVVGLICVITVICIIYKRYKGKEQSKIKNNNSSVKPDGTNQELASTANVTVEGEDEGEALPSYQDVDT